MSEATDRLYDRMKTAVGPNKGFALFIATGDGMWTYISSNERESMVRALEEWLRRTSPTGPMLNIPKKSETTEEVDDRLALERHCAEIGEVIGEKTRMGLFVFEVGGKNMAYITNEPNFHSFVRQWVTKQKNRN